MPRTPGHKLIREAEGWRCECGHDLGALSVHKARAAHREHKAEATAPVPEAEAV